MGPVYRAYDPERDRLVAVKAFRLDLTPERAHQLVAEFERLIAAAVAHPALVAPLSAGIDGVVPYLVQEYVAAESLDIVLRQPGAVSAGDAVLIATGLAGALDAAALAGIDHGVLHPRDILLSADDTRLTGLGIARALERVGVSTAVRRPYTAAERTVGSEWDRRSDVFALAAVVYEMLAGKRLSGTGGSAARALPDIAGADPKQLRAVFAKALATDPAQRFDTALELAGALVDAFALPPNVRTAISQRAVSEPIAPAVPAPLPVPEVATAEIEPELPLQAHVDLSERPDNSVLAEPPRAPQMEPALRETRERLETRVSDEPWDAVEATRAAPEPLLLRHMPPVVPPDPPQSYRAAVDDPAGAGERERSSISPLAFALLIGAAVGFAAGFGVGARDRQADFEPVVGDASREFTEGQVGGVAGQSGETGGQPDPAAPAAGPAAPRTPQAATAAPAPSPAPTGSLLVRSTPTGARVFVDNRELGRTPVTIGSLSRGAHRVRVMRDGYVPDERQVTISSVQRAHSLTVRLLPERTPASNPGASPQPVGTASAAEGTATSAPLSVESRPPGARVFLDGRLVGTTPVVVAAVPTGNHSVYLERDGYQRWSSAIRIDPSVRNRVAASLDRTID